MNNNEMPGATSEKISNILSGTVGLWLVLSPFVLGFTALPAALWNTLLVGFLLLVLAWRRTPSARPHFGLRWRQLLLGIWLLVSPLALSYATAATAAWNGLVFGVVLTVLAIWGTGRPVPQRVRR